MCATAGSVYSSINGSNIVSAEGRANLFEAVEDEHAEDILKNAMRQFSLSARAYHRILKISRTIADLAGTQNITIAHVAEALQYRPKIAEE